MTLGVRGYDIDTLPDTFRKVAVLSFPTLDVHLHERLERVCQARQVRLCGRIPGRREGDGDGESQRHSNASGRGVGGGVGRGRERGGYAEDRW
jgi:hypothetical protein